ncbi:glycosyltransferase [Paenibacillus chartarius]|uniref:Glycosyltransferase n=1 Tax=Paenibacillus chartarius TaxID=747481 RepID=A0ABV6DH56_9BACL
MRNKTVIVEIEFNNRSKPNNKWKVGLTKRWIEYRMSIFMKYTLQSLKKQTNQHFTALVRYAPESEKLIRQTLKKYKPLPGNIRFVTDSRLLDVKKRLAQGSRYLYLVRLDCDDTYNKTYVQQLHDAKPKSGVYALINQKGYVHDSVHHRVAPIYLPSPPFYTWIYKTKEYIRGKRYNVRGHGQVIRHKHEIMTTNGKRNYMIIVHKKNTLNQNLLSKCKFVKNRAKVKLVLKKFI